ncbi:hypothetical protein [Vibrio europaeus]|uniref:hypothetical protein n=1 Tax=Vibrio europaeus TaxID=300876 RepID=UPI00233E9BC5|nr:hypothetical protein [Vibrio europaeus]MDC5753579.1 hypothetical protein [Vibrio europaeus]MDC5816508.1 hypothetical protein [Vibrio europaeus]
MGRRGGYGRTGKFAEDMQLNVWYSIRDVQAFFRTRKQDLEPLQAKAIIDSLHKSKCYKTEKKIAKQGGICIMLKERIRYRKGEQKIPEALVAQTVDLKTHFSYLLLNSDWGCMPNQKVFDLKKSDPLVNEIAQASQESRPIKYEGVLCALTACKNDTPTHVKIVLEQMSDEVARQMSQDVYFLQLS